MLRDYHMHPMVVQDASRFDQFAARALELGIEEVCITDHMPLSLSCAKDRIPKGMVKDYCRKGREIIKKYDGILSVKLGIEIDYHPSFLDEINTVLNEGEFDFVLGSSHMHLFLKDQLDGRMSRDAFARMALENTLSAVQSDLFDIITHMDMFRWAFTRDDRYAFSDSEYHIEEHMDLIEKILDEMVKRNMCLEINPHFAEKKMAMENMYPQLPIVEMALEKNIKFGFGSDAHKPQSVGVMLDMLLKHPVYGKALAQK